MLIAFAVTCFLVNKTISLVFNTIQVHAAWSALINEPDLTDLDPIGLQQCSDN